jgi:hypothetical protein
MQMAPLLDSLRMEKLAEHATEKVLAQRVLCDQLGQDATQETPLVDIEKILLQTLGSAGELVHAKVCTVFLVDNSSAELVSAHEFASGQIRERDEEIRVRAHLTAFPSLRRKRGCRSADPPFVPTPLDRYRSHLASYQRVRSSASP